VKAPLPLGLALAKGRAWFRSQMGHNNDFLMMWVVRHWNRSLREAADAPPVGVLKARLDGTSGRCPCPQQGVELGDLPRSLW